jgi:hypothetical protein
MKPFSKSRKVQTLQTIRNNFNPKRKEQKEADNSWLLNFNNKIKNSPLGELKYIPAPDFNTG